MNEEFNIKSLLEKASKNRTVCFCVSYLITGIIIIGVLNFFDPISEDDFMPPIILLPVLFFICFILGPAVITILLSSNPIGWVLAVIIFSFPALFFWLSLKTKNQWLIYIFCGLSGITTALLFGSSVFLLGLSE